MPSRTVAALAACLLAPTIPTALADGVYQTVDAFYSLDAFAGLAYTDGLTSTDLGPQSFTIGDELFGRYAVQAGVTSSFNSFADSITMSANAVSITRAGSPDQVETNTEQTITFDLLVDVQATLRSFNLGWRATVSNNGAAVCSTVLADAAGNTIVVREAPDTFEFFTEVVNLPAGRYTWSIFGYTGSDDAPGFPLQTQHSASLNAILELRFIAGFGPCNAADLAAPIGQLTFADISAFLSAFSAQNPSADLAAPAGQFTFADITAFLAAFSAGCP